MVATGWGVSCKNLNSSSSFSCTGYQYSGLAQQGMSLVPHGGEIIAAAVCYIKNISQKLIFFLYLRPVLALELYCAVLVFFFT